MDYSMPGLLVPHHLLKFAQVHVHWIDTMLFNHLILCHPLLLLCSIFPSIRVFSDESALCIRWAKYWSFSSSPSNEYSMKCFLFFIFFRIKGKCLMNHVQTQASQWRTLGSKGQIFYIPKKLQSGSQPIFTLHFAATKLVVHFWVWVYH